jgi:hypothetical protein
MIDIVDLLGKDNILSQQVMRLRRLEDNSLTLDLVALQKAAGIDVVDTQVAAGKYEGPVLNLVFESHLSSDSNAYWRAEMLISDFGGGDNATIEDGDTIKIDVSGYSGKLIEKGLLRLFGLELHVANGKTSCTLAQLQSGLLKTNVSLQTPQSGIVPGHLSLC